MTEAAREAQRAYNRRWAREHKEQRRAAQERYWNGVAARAAERDSAESRKQEGAMSVERGER